MSFDTDFAQEERAIQGRKTTNTILSIVAAVTLAGALAAFMFMEAPVIAGVLAVAGASLFGAAYVRNSGIEKDYVDLQARKSAAGLTQSLKAKGVALTPEQQASIRQEEYDKTSAEWRERMAEVKRAREIGD